MIMKIKIVRKTKPHYFEESTIVLVCHRKLNHTALFRSFPAQLYVSNVKEHVKKCQQNIISCFNYILNILKQFSTTNLFCPPT